MQGGLPRYRRNWRGRSGRGLLRRQRRRVPIEGDFRLVGEKRSQLEVVKVATIDEESAEKRLRRNRTSWETVTEALPVTESLSFSEYPTFLGNFSLDLMPSQVHLLLDCGYSLAFGLGISSESGGVDQVFNDMEDQAVVQPGVAVPTRGNQTVSSPDVLPRGGESSRGTGSVAPTQPLDESTTAEKVEAARKLFYQEKKKKEEVSVALQKDEGGFFLHPGAMPVQEGT